MGGRGLETMILHQIAGVVRRLADCQLLCIMTRLESHDIPHRCAAMFADLSKGQVADVHSPDHKRPRLAYNARDLVRGELLVLRQHRDAFAADKPVEDLRHECRRLWGQGGRHYDHASCADGRGIGLCGGSHLNELADLPTINIR